MVEIVVEQQKLIFGVPARGNFFLRTLELPIECVTGVGIDPIPVRDWLRKLEFLAEFVPPLKREGAFYEDSGCLFWEVEDPERTIVVSMRRQAHEKLIVGVQNPYSALQTIENALLHGCTEIKAGEVLEETTESENADENKKSECK